jgi:TrmH family RNA methyltransferase
VITSTKNPAIVEVAKLAQRKYRQRQRRFLVEGLKIIGMALEGGAKPLEAFYCSEQFQGSDAPKLLDRLGNSGARLVDVSPQVMQRLADRDSPQGLLATFELLDTSLEVLRQRPHATTRLVLVLDRLQDPGNLGTLIRTADATGAHAVALIEPCVDPFDPKTVSATMGSIFNLPIARTGNVNALFEILSPDLTIVGADAHEGEIAWDSDALAGPTALILGNETRSLSTDVRSHVEHWVRLPLLGQAESLNVAVAGGVLAYCWLQKQDEQASSHL